MNTAIIRLEQQLAAATDTRERLALLHRLGEAVHRSDVHRALACVQEALALAEQIQDDFWIAISLYTIGVCLAAMTHYEKALSYYARAEQIFKAGGNTERRAQLLYNMGIIYNNMGDTARALQLFRESLALFEALDIPVWKARVLTLLTGVLTRSGCYVEALDSGQKALRIFEQQNNSLETAIVLNNIAILYQQMRAYDKALEAFERSLAIRAEQQDIQGEVHSLSNIAQLYLDLRQASDALHYLLRVVQLLPRNGGAGAPGIYAQIGEAYRQLGDRRQAMKHYKKAAALMSRTEDTKFTGHLLLSMAHCLLEGGRYKQALVYLKQAEPHAARIQDKALRCSLDKAYADVYEHTGDTAAALVYHRRYAELREVILNEQQQRLFAEMQARFDLESAGRERELQQLRADRLQSEMEEKNRQLTALALQLVHKNSFIAQVREQMESLAPDSPQKLKEVIGRLEAGRQSDNDWEQFSKQFRQAHHEFYPALLHLCPALTPAELKICSLMKLNLSTKDIANFLYIAPRTVEIHRGRIRKKLRLPSSTSLAAFLINL